jgi:hypothetical protein
MATPQDTGLNEVWEKWCREAADKAGISIEEVKRRLAFDEGALEIHAIVDKKKPSAPTQFHGQGSTGSMKQWE